MEQSAFIQWIDKYFKGIVVKVTEKLNDKTNNTLTYLHKDMLRKEFSVSGKWESINSLNSRVSADFVSMDASLPLKRRDWLGKASGDIAKSGMELWLNEKQLSDLDAMVSDGRIPESEIIAKLFQDTPRVIAGIYELMEKAFLEGFSTGVTTIDDTENVGTGVNLDFGYFTANKFGVTQFWNNVSAKPLDDLRRVIKKAALDGNTLTDVYTDDVTFDNFAATQQVKDYFAWGLKFDGSLTIVPVPSVEEINTILKRDNKYRIAFHIIDRKIINERNGTRTVVTPWSEGKVVMTGTTQVGSLVYARLAEMNHPVAGVSYQTADDFILVSKFRQNRPSLAEYTTSQARVVPVICDVDKIYQIDAKVLQP